MYWHAPLSYFESSPIYFCTHASATPKNNFFYFFSTILKAWIISPVIKRRDNNLLTCSLQQLFADYKKNMAFSGRCLNRQASNLRSSLLDLPPNSPSGHLQIAAPRWLFLVLSCGKVRRKAKAASACGKPGKNLKLILWSWFLSAFVGLKKYLCSLEDTPCVD